MLNERVVRTSLILTVFLMLGPAFAKASSKSESLLQLRRMAGPEAAQQVPKVAQASEPKTLIEENTTATLPKEASRLPVRCYVQARKELSATPWGAVMLCSGTALPQAPIYCFKNARSRLNDMGSLLLCSGTDQYMAPVSCYDEALKIGLNALGSATLCHAAGTPYGPILCYKDARQYLNAVGAVELCGGVPYELYNRIFHQDNEKLSITEGV